MNEFVDIWVRDNETAKEMAYPGQSRGHQLHDTSDQSGGYHHSQSGVRGGVSQPQNSGPYDPRFIGQQSVSHQHEPEYGVGHSGASQYDPRYNFSIGQYPTGTEHGGYGQEYDYKEYPGHGSGGNRDYHGRQ
ncbi:hypothetical protein ACQ4LE_007764 [Meloidogyne hapla]|uniref:Uncharacterized protein n=1 Tax=Meloidogyne hapla TaxID=6305 RepID=A0A1I8BUS1_MELHA